MQSTDFSLILSPKLQHAAGQSVATVADSSTVAEGAFWLNLAAQLAALEESPSTATDAELTADDLLAQLAAELGLEPSSLSVDALSADDLITMIEGQTVALHPTALAAAVHAAVHTDRGTQIGSVPQAHVQALSERIAEVLQSQSLPAADVTALSERIAEVLQSQSLPKADVQALSARIAEVLQSQSLPAGDLKTLSTRIAEALQSQADVKTLSTRIAEALQARQVDGLRTDLAATSARGNEAIQAATTESRFSPLLSHALATPTQANPLFNLDVPLRQPGWDRAVGERIQWMVNQKVQLAELKLNPPHLGQLEVRVRMEGERAHIHFIAPLATVREALELALPRLRDMFADGDMNLGEVTVSQHGAEQGGAERQASQTQTGSPAGLADEATEREGDTLPTTPLVHSQGLIDYYA